MVAGARLTKTYALLRAWQKLHATFFSVCGKDTSALLGQKAEAKGKSSALLERKNIIQNKR